MARLAWFTPLPPTTSGIAAYNADLLPLVAVDHAVDVFADPPPGRLGRETSAVGHSPEHNVSADPDAPAGLAILPAHEFAWRHRRAPYDLVVYQLGNAACHDFIWPHLPRYPGLVVLHDGQLHHARARRLLADKRLDDYRAEFRYNHPDAPPEVAELVIAALAGSMYYVYPMLRWVLRSARLVAVHSPGLARDLRETYPGVEVHTIRHGMGDPWADGQSGGGRGAEGGNGECRMQDAECGMQDAEGGDEGRSRGEAPVDRLPPTHLTAAAHKLRGRYRIPDDAVLFGAFGLVTPEKRIGAALRGLASLATEQPRVHLLLAGGTTAHYDALAEARALGVEERVHVTGYVADEELPAHVEATDVCLCLRWPTGGETSGTWLRAIAAGKPTIVTDLAHAGQAPTLDPQTWTVLPPTLARASTPLDLGSGRPEHRRGTPPEPVSVSIDVLDEVRLLALAMRRLAADAGLREALGRAARRYWSLHHTMSCAVDDYRLVIERALERPVECRRDLPVHLLPDPVAAARALAAQMGVERDLLHLTPITPGGRLNCL